MKFDACPVEPPGFGSGPLSSCRMSVQPRRARWHARPLPTMPAPMTTTRALLGRLLMALDISVGHGMAQLIYLRPVARAPQPAAPRRVTRVRPALALRRSIGRRDRAAPPHALRARPAAARGGGGAVAGVRPSAGGAPPRHRARDRP